MKTSEVHSLLVVITSSYTIMSDNFPTTITMFNITKPLLYSQDKETEDLTPSINCSKYYDQGSDQCRPIILNIKFKPQSHGPLISTHRLSPPFADILSHLSIRELSFLHSQGEFTPFPVQRQYNWERKVTLASKKFKCRLLSFGDGSTTRPISLPPEFKPQFFCN